MRISLLLLLMLVNPTVFAEKSCVGLLAKLERQVFQSEIPAETVLPYPKINVREVFGIFLKAVDLGQMQLFYKTLTREMLYTLEDQYPTVNVYSELLKPISLPAMPDVYIIGVSGIMDVSGNIIESIAHCDIQ